MERSIEKNETNAPSQNASCACKKYEQMNKNNVSAKGQLQESELVKFDFPSNSGVRIMFVGNSITLHGVRESIGWYHAHGMAASTKDNDYVHIVERAVLKRAPHAAFCICQVADWERQYKCGTNTHQLYHAARDFGADIIVIRCIENCPASDLEPLTFKKELDLLIRYLDKNGTAKIIITTGFWHHPLDTALREYASKHTLPCIELGDLGEDDTMKAIGLFEHDGVASHPGDKGMEAIASRIMEAITSENDWLR